MSATTAQGAMQRPPVMGIRLQHLARAAVLHLMIRYLMGLKERLPLASHERMLAGAELLAMTSRRAAHLAAAAGDQEMQQEHLAEAAFFNSRRARLQSGGLFL